MEQTAVPLKSNRPSSLGDEVFKHVTPSYTAVIQVRAVARKTGKSDYYFHRSIFCGHVTARMERTHIWEIGDQYYTMNTDGSAAKVKACMNCFEIVDTPVFENALCFDMDQDVFFPEGHSPTKYNKAKELCGRCDHTAECLQYALDAKMTKGVWGGTSPEERKRM